MSHFEAMNAPIHTGNGGNVITDGRALTPDDNEVDCVDHNKRRHVCIALIVYCVLFVAGLVVLACRIF